MTSIVFLVEQMAIGLYILIAMGIVLAVRGWLRARDAYRATYFELERDIARYQQANAGTMMVLLIEAALIVLGIQQVVAPTLRDTLDIETSFVQVVSDGFAPSPTPFRLEGGAPIDASNVQLEEFDPAAQVMATPTLTPTPVGTIIPNAPAPVGCDTPNASLQIPANGMVVFTPMNVIGTAFVDDFACYRFEISGPSTFNSFAPREDHTIPVTELGELGQFIPSFYEQGQYQFRLAVFDITNTLKASCTITIYISDPIPTPTPLGQDLGFSAPPIGVTPPAGSE